MNKMEWKYSEDKKHIILDKKPTRFKYLTGTRFASALGLNPYSTPFQIWCEIFVEPLSKR